MTEGIGMALSVLKKVWAILSAIVTMLFGFVQGTPKKSDGVELVNQTQYSLEDALLLSQGLATDGTYLYTGGAVSAVYLGSLGKIDRTTGEIVKRNTVALPYEFTSQGYDHIGGIGYYDGKIYAAVEDRAEEYPLVLLYDAQTLEYTGVYYDCTNERLDDGIPWCTVDADNGYLYTSTYHNADEILAYRLDTMEFSHTIKLDKTVDRVQAGAYLDGKLYLNIDTQNDDETKEVHVVDLATGETKLDFVRNTGGIKTETEGICVERTDDGGIRYFIADYDKTVSMFIREYVKNN